MGINVIMMGGRRCGKTSALASLFHQIINGETHRFLTVNDATKPKKKPIEGTNTVESIETLSDKRLELVHFIKKRGHNTFLADENPTFNYWDYTLRIQIPGTSRTTDINFRDGAGEIFDSRSQHYEETKEYVKSSDVFVIVVDTPYLMAGEDYENEAANIVNQIHSLLTHIDLERDTNKQVIFVPIKCERWYHEGKIDEVTAKVEKTYRASISHLIASNKTEISIIPILTAGNIVFSEFRDSYILYKKDKNTDQKCSKSTDIDETVCLSDGSFYRLKDGDILNEDPNAVFDGTGIMRPSPWYCLRQPREYAPYNCEQLPLHILRFIFNKLELEAYGGLLGRLRKFFLGSITREDMATLLATLKEKKLIKDSGDGIKIIHTCF